MCREMPYITLIILLFCGTYEVTFVHSEIVFPAYGECVITCDFFDVGKER